MAKLEGWLDWDPAPLQALEGRSPELPGTPSCLRTVTTNPNVKPLESDFLFHAGPGDLQWLHNPLPVAAPL